MTTHTAAHHLLQGLAETGVQYVFANTGTDHVALIEAMADWDDAPPLTVMLVPHETVAMAMATGFAMATGRGQAVLVHVDAGTANAAMGMHNAFRSRVPVLLLAGRAPYTLHGERPGSRDNYVHFVQDPFDIGSVVRPYVKWEYGLADGIVAKEALRRAHSVMHSDPPGPVSMTLPREVLAAEIADADADSYPAADYGPVHAGGVAPDVAAQLADALMTADAPMAITTYLGRNGAAVAALQALAVATGMRVVEAAPTYMNLPRTSSCHAGFDAAAIMAHADLGLLLDTDVPFLPAAGLGAHMRWLHIDVDAIKRDFPMWGFCTHLRAEADAATVLAQVLDAVRARATPAFDRRVAERIAAWPSATPLPPPPGTTGAIDAGYVCAEIARRLDPADIVVNEAIRNTGAVLGYMPRTLPGTYFANAGGGLGFSGGAALGIRLAHPNRRVVQVAGDGTTHFCAPDSVFATAQRYGLPIFAVVLDNGGWSAVKQATLRAYPAGRAAATGRFQSALATGLDNEARRFDAVAAAFGAHGEYVTDPADLGSAVDRCIAAIDRGQAALLHVQVTTL